MKVKKDGTESEKELITDGFIIYKVKLGDNLKSIASHYGLKVDDIKKDNNTSTNKVKEGDESVPKSRPITYFLFDSIV